MGTFPPSSPELVARPANGLSFRRDADGLRSPSLLDPETGHYTAVGIRRRLRELAALSQSNNEALSCVVFGADKVSADMQLRKRELIDAEREFSLALHGRTRRADVVGRLGHLLFVVLAPRTPPAGGLRLAERFTTESLWRYEAGVTPVTFSAGVAGFDGRVAAGARPDRLVAAAAQALDSARAAGAAQVAAAWGGVL